MKPRCTHPDWRWSRTTGECGEVLRRGGAVMTREEVRAINDAYDDREAREAPLVKAFGRCSVCAHPGSTNNDLRGVADALCLLCGGDGHGLPSPGECVVCGDARRADDTTEYCEECQDKAERQWNRFTEDEDEGRPVEVGPGAARVAALQAIGRGTR